MRKKYLLWIILCIGTAIIIFIVAGYNDGLPGGDIIESDAGDNENNRIVEGVEGVEGVENTAANETPAKTPHNEKIMMKQEDINNVIQAVTGFKNLGDTVDYRTVDKGYRNEFLYYFSSGGNSLESVNEWIEEVKANTVVSEANFIADKLSVYIDADHYTRVRGTFYIKYGTETNEGYLRKKGMEAGEWYSRDEELLFYIAVDDHKWARGEWVFYKGYILTDWRKA